MSLAVGKVFTLLNTKYVVMSTLEKDGKHYLFVNKMITDLLEALTIFCFGLSWPISIRKSIISRTAKGKSLFFEVFLQVVAKFF